MNTLLSASDAKAMFYELARHMSDMFFIMDDHLRYLFWNTASETITGISAESAIGKSLDDLFPASDAINRAKALYKHVIATQGHDRLREFVTLQNKQYYFDVVAFYVQGVGIGVQVTDLTVMNATEQEVHTTKQYLEQVLSSMSDAVFACDSAGVVQHCNKVAQDILRIPKEEIVGTSIADCLRITDSDGSVVALPLEQMIARQQTIVLPSQIFLMHQHHSGSLIPIEASIAPLKFAQESPAMGAVLVVRDISEQVALERQVEDEKLRWEFALSGNRDGVWDWNAATNEVFFSSQWKSMLGFEEHEIQGKLDEWTLRVHPDDLPKALEDLRHYFEGRTEYYENEHRMKHKNGEYRWILDRGKIVSRRTDGSPLRVVGTHTDITSFKRMEKELKEKERFITKVNEIGKLGGWWVDLATHEVRWTQSMYAIHEHDHTYSPTREDGLNYFPPSTAALLAEMFEQSVATCMGFDIVVPFITAKGNDRWVRVIAEPMCQDGVCISVQGIMQDISLQYEQTRKIETMNSLLESAKRDLEVKVRHRTRELELTNSQLYGAMMQKERLLSFISHEFQTPLHVISLALQSLQAPLEQPEFDYSQTKFNAIARQIAHLKELTQTLVYTSKTEKKESKEKVLGYSPVEINELCRQAISYCEDWLYVSASVQNRQMPDIIIENRDDMMPVYIERHLVFQILSHILRNLIVHTASGSSIAITCDTTAVSATIRLTIRSRDISDGENYAHHLEHNLVYLDAYVQDDYHADLDLSLARRMVDACKGKISVRYDTLSSLVIDIHVPTHNGVISDANKVVIPFG